MFCTSVVSSGQTAASSRQRGMTLAELLVTLGVIATLTTGAGSMYHALVQENRMVTEVNLFIAALQLARSEAVKHGRRVLLCPSRDKVNCGNSSAWTYGWMLFASDNREREAGETLLHTGNPLAAGVILHASNYRKRIMYQPDGSSGGSNSAFTFCDIRKIAKPRVICLSNSGRPRLTYTRCDGSPIRCP